MTEVTMSAIVGEMSATVGERPQQWRNVCNSGEIEYGLGNSRVQIVNHNSAYINSEDTWNNMLKAA